MSAFYKYSKEVSLKQLQYEQAKQAPAVRICNNYLFVQISSTLFYDVCICVVALQLNLNFIEIIYS